jgi:hypothetical protein
MRRICVEALQISHVIWKPESVSSEEILKNEALTNRAEALLASWEKRLASGEIDEVKWYRGVAAEIMSAYLSGDNPRTQSGFQRR